MKKIFSFVLILSVLLCTSCSGTGSTLDEVSISAEDVSELSARIGIEMSLPDSAGNVKCSIINDLIGETEFTYNGIIFVHRASKAYSDEALYGVSGRLSETDTFMLGEDIEVIVSSFEDGATIATWYETGNHHSLYTQKTVGSDLLSEIAEKL